MKKGIVFIMSAVLAVSLGSFGFAEAQKAPAKPAAAAAKTPAKPAAKPAAAKPAPAPKTIVLIKGIKIEHCGKAVKDNGSVEIMSGIKSAVKKGKFDLVLPAVYVAPVKKQLAEGEEDNSDPVERPNGDVDFGDANIFYIGRVMFNNAKHEEYSAGGTAYLSVMIFYADKDVKGTVNGKEVSLKKGWNVIGDKKIVTATCPCVG